MACIKVKKKCAFWIDIQTLIKLIGLFADALFIWGFWVLCILSRSHWYLYLPNGFSNDLSLSLLFLSRASERSHLALLSLHACEMTVSSACPPVEWAVVLDSETEIKRSTVEMGSAQHYSTWYEAHEQICGRLGPVWDHRSLQGVECVEVDKVRAAQARNDRKPASIQRQSATRWNDILKISTLA